MSQRAQTSGSINRKIPTVPNSSKVSPDIKTPKGSPIPSFPKSQAIPSGSGLNSSDTPLKESIDRIYDESERCLDRTHMIHGTNVPNGKMIIWEIKESKASTTGQSTAGRSADKKQRSPLFKINIANGQRHGRFREYYPSGRPKFETYFQMNQEIGPRRNWKDQVESG